MTDCRLNNTRDKARKLAVLVAIASALAAVSAGCGSRVVQEQAVQPELVHSPAGAGSGLDGTSDSVWQKGAESDGEMGTEPGEEGADLDKPGVPYTAIAPLTGLPVERELTERPIMVLVENSPQARPQTGLDEADLVYELLAEGDITRFAAVYHSRSPEVIGPVRSLRPYFAELGEGLDAYIVHAGWSPAAKEMLIKRKLHHFDEVYGDGEYYWRDKKRKMPNNLYTSIQLIRQGVQDKKYRLDWKKPKPMFMEPQANGATDAGREPENGGLQTERSDVNEQLAAKATIAYMRSYSVSYEYEPERGVYLRSMNGKPHNDAATGKTLSAANVIICFAPHRVVDSVGRREIGLSGPGEAILLRDGKRMNVTWERKDGLIRLYQNGKEIGLKPGQTWVQIVPTATPVKFG